MKYYPAVAEVDQVCSEVELAKIFSRLCFQEIAGQTISDQKYEERMEEEDFGDTKTGRIRTYLWNLTEYPETGLAARVSTF